ncbi:dentin sialophosphoprotein [Malaya genurostris]|uniref:dentin sialophosphoprotein n=1 Tax=Malaya genurostris TaxID=325434 RepID=UPI0026F38874|nr:dentin sialophosphoprotein [Malaya genurostris]XP_058443119.1 dentin sialophosphoprotein [Malaya genurostris]XP_058443120.1 dentin sialophosphoprotein [Malaya genurostris]XP_058443121.1 dentin sialophosphoprotein [Malaya genurostris]XP_058443122.1 dentin sialophosphoprotein [Malaya genurostris]XP_058443123.1 dentin sialophosphoprotein [Malaya genurostris]
MTLYWWTHWFWITVCGVILIECTPLSSIDSYPSKLSKLEENSNKSTYLKRAGPGSSFISSLPPMAAASSGQQPSPTNTGSPAAPTVNSIVSDEAFVQPHQQDIDDTFAGGSLADTDFGPDIVRYTRTGVEASSTVSVVENVAESDIEKTISSTVPTPVAGAGRLKKNGTIFTRNEQNITTLKLKNYNRGMEKEDLKESSRLPNRGTRLVETLMLTAVDNSTDAALLTLEHASDAELVNEDDNDTSNITNVNIPEDSPDNNATLPAEPEHIAEDVVALQPPTSSSDSNSSFSSRSSSSNSNIYNSTNRDSSSIERDIPDSSHSDSTSSVSVSASDRRIGKILSSDFRDFVSNGNNPNASSYISRAIAFSTQNLQEGIDDQDHPLEDDDYRRSSRSQQRLNVGAISGICLASLGLLSGLSAVLIILYRRYLYINKPQTLSEPDSSGYIDDSTIRDNSDEMYSLDNDSFLNSLEAMTIQNYWTDNVKHTKL